jgi:hypothetical protein
MTKLPLVLLALAGTCVAQNERPLAQLQGAHVIMVFSPDTNSANFKKQLQLIEHHAYELTERNTVVVPVATKGGDDYFSGENLPLEGSEQVDARNRYHVQPGQFLVVLINKDGVEQVRSVSPMDIHELTAHLDPPPKH